MSRFLLAQAPRHLPPWLIFDVRQKMKKPGYLLLFLVILVELRANPVAPGSAFGFNSGWTVITGLLLEFAIAYSILRKHLAAKREFPFRFCGVHIATLPICFIASALDDVAPWILAQGLVVLIEAWFYVKAPGRPKWKIATLASLAANASSAVFAVATHKL